MFSRFARAVLALTLLAPPSLRAWTSVFLSNQSDEPMCVTETVVTHRDPGLSAQPLGGGQPALSARSWRNPSGGNPAPEQGCLYVVSPGQRIQPLTFEPDAVPTGTSVWFLTRVRAKSGETTVLKQKVDGEPFDYTMWFGIDQERLVRTAGSPQGYTWSRAATATVASSTTRVEYQRLDVTGDDDIEYVFRRGERRGAGPQAPSQLRVLAMHAGFLSLETPRLESRVAMLPAALGRDFDVVVVTGLIEGRARVALRQALEPALPYATRIGSDGGAFKEDGGVVLFSRLPIVSDDARVLPADPHFSNDSKHWPRFDRVVDASRSLLSYDAAVHAKIEVGPGRHVHVIGATTGAREGMRTQDKHLELVREMIAARVPEGEPLIVAGDHLAGLGFEAPEVQGHASTATRQDVPGGTLAVDARTSVLVARRGSLRPGSFATLVDIEAVQKEWSGAAVEIDDGQAMFAYLPLEAAPVLVTQAPPPPQAAGEDPVAAILGFD